jgi:hypothetical protein
VSEITESSDIGYLHCGIAKIDSRAMTMKVPSSACMLIEHRELVVIVVVGLPID